MTQPTNRLVREWIKSLPGLFSGSTPDECLRKAWAASGVSCSVVDFERVLRNMGFMTKPVRPGLYYLTLPERGAGVK